MFFSSDDAQARVAPAPPSSCAAAPASRHEAPIRSILAIFDFASRGDNAVQRAQLLAAQTGARLEVMDLSGLALADHPASVLAEAAALAQSADLVVMADRRDPSPGAFFRGQPPLRLLRACGRPLLVARAGAVRPYARILVGTDLAEATSARLLAHAAQLEPGAAVELFHALDVRDEAKLRSAEAPVWAVRQFRQRRVAQAGQRIAQLAAACDAVRDPAQTHIGHGDPAQQLARRQRATSADLVVVGKRPASWAGDFFRGSVAARLLAWSTSDVLVLPGQAEGRAGRPLPALRRGGMQPAMQQGPV